MADKNSITRRSFMKNIGLVSAIGISNPQALSIDSGERGSDTVLSKYKKALTGPCISVRTPFSKDGTIDYEALQKQINISITNGANAVILTYGDSLFSLLSDDEIAQLTRKCAEIVNKRVTFIAATGQWTTQKAEEFASYSSELGADMLMVLPPDWAHSCTVETLVNHYAAAARHIPVMVVNNYLGSRSPAFALSVIKALYENVPGVVALKDDVTGTLVRQICLMTYERWALIAGGQKQNHINMLPYGVDGYFSLMTTFNPEIAQRYWNAIRDNQMEDAIAIVRDYDMPVFNYLVTLEGGFDAGMHGMLEICGLGKRYRRKPYYSLNGEQMEKLRDFMLSKPYVQVFV